MTILGGLWADIVGYGSFAPSAIASAARSPLTPSILWRGAQLTTAASGQYSEVNVGRLRAPTYHSQRMKLFSFLMRKVKGGARQVRRLAFPSPALPLSAETIDLGVPEIARDPFRYYELLRSGGSVQYLPKHGAWIVLGYDDVQEAMSRPQHFSNAPYNEIDAVLLGADPPEQAAVRRVITRYFSAQALDRLCAFAEAYAISLLKPELEIVQGYGLPLSEGVAAELLGLDEVAVNEIRAARLESSDVPQLIVTLDRIAERAAMYEALRGDGMTDGQSRSLIRLLWLAATTTTERVIARCVLRLLRHPDLRAKLQASPDLIAPFVEEVLRLHPPELMVPRQTKEATELGGVTIPAGALVYLSVAAANRDPAKYDNPGELRLDRSSPRHFSFGSGIHHCIGATLGRREIATSLRVLLQHAPRFEASAPLEETELWSTMTANAVARLTIRMELDVER